MADKNLSIEDILNEYSGKVSNSSKDTVANNKVDIDSLLSDIGRSAPQKTEMIEDVLEIGDNSYAFDPDTLPYTQQEESIPPVAEDDSQPSEKITASDIREGKKTTFGTQALEEVLSEMPQKPAEENTPAPKKSKSEATSEPTIRPMKESGSNTSIIEGLMKLKKERGTVKSEPKVPPVNRASIDDIDLDIERKVIPNTEIGIDENATEEERLAYLNAKRRERVKQFVIDSEESEPDKDDVADFNSFEQAQDMAKSIFTLKSSLIVRLCVLILCSIVSVYITLANDLGLPLIDILTRANNSGTAFLFTNVVLGLAACFVSYTVLIVGFKKLITLKPDSDSLASIAMIISLVTGIVMLSDSELVQMQRVHIYIPAAIIGLLINTIGKLLIVTRTERNFRYIAGGYSKYAAMHIDDETVASKFTKGALRDFPSLTTSRKTEFVSDFIKNSYSADMTDSFCKFFVPAVTLLSVILGVVAGFVHPEDIATTQSRVFYGMSVASGTIAMCSAVGMMLVTNIPLAKASKKYLQSGAVMLGYSAVDKFSDTNSLLIDAVDLFPDGMVDIINIKPTKKTPIEEGILYAASLCCQTESILRPAFYKMIKGKTEMLYPVESYLYEDSLGLSGWIQNKRILFGSRQLMESHSIESLPTPEKEAQYAGKNSVLYLSIGGSFAMLFVVQMKASVSVTNALKELEKNNITVILRSVDSLLSLSRLTELFGVAPDMFKLLPFRYHSDYDASTSYVAKMSSPMIYSGRFASLATLLTGTKKLFKASTVGVVIQGLSAALGFVLSLVLLLSGSFATSLTGTVAAIYCLIWALITAIVQSFART